MNSLSNNKPNANAVSLTDLHDSKEWIQRKETQRPRRAAVIGGGPSGIQAAGQLIKRNFHVTVFERHSQLGGIWYYEKNEHLSQPSPYQGIKPFLPLEVSPVYREMRTNVPFQSMGIDGFPVPQLEDIRFVHRSEILDYLSAYVRHMEQEYPNLVDYRLNSNIESVTYDHGWSVISREMDKVVHGTFDVVVVATGAFHKPLVTNLHDAEYEGVYFHSLYYDDPSVLDNRTVLVVGGKNSARDVFWDATGRAKHVVLACPTEKDRNNVVFPEDDCSKLKERCTFVGRVKRIRKDGAVIHTNWQGKDEVLDGIGVDMIVYCTGYRREFPFLPDELQPVSTASDGSEITNCFMYTAHKDHPNSLFFFHPSKARTPFNTMARDTHAQARLIASLASRKAFTEEQLQGLDETLQAWLDTVYTEWAKESLNSCPCAVQNPLFMNYLNAIVDYEDELLNMENVGSKVMGFVRHNMKDREFRKQNTIWHAGMELRVRADAANWNLFRFLRGRLTGGPGVNGDRFFTVTWFLEDGTRHSTFHEYEIKYEDLILMGVPRPHSIKRPSNVQLDGYSMSIRPEPLAESFFED
jgi:thioredoxin reductase